MIQDKGYVRYRILRLLVLGVGVVLLARLFGMQILSDKYDAMATSNIIREEIEYNGVSVIIPRRECIQTLNRKLRQKRAQN